MAGTGAGARSAVVTLLERRPRAESRNAGYRLPGKCVGGGEGFLPAPATHRPLHPDPLSSGVLPSPRGYAGAMERVVGPFLDAFSGHVLQSEAPGPPPDCGVPDGDAGAEPQEPCGDCSLATPPEPLPFPGDASLPVTPKPEERRAHGVCPARASPALAAPGQPRDSARWMLCVAGAKLKVSGGARARSTLCAHGGDCVCVCVHGLEGPPRRLVSLGGSPKCPPGRATAPSGEV